MSSPTGSITNVLDAPVQSWWLGLVAGRKGEPHPVSPRVRGLIEDHRVTLSGTGAVLLDNPHVKSAYLGA